MHYLASATSCLFALPTLRLLAYRISPLRPFSDASKASWLSYRFLYSASRAPFSCWTYA